MKMERWHRGRRTCALCGRHQNQLNVTVDSPNGHSGGRRLQRRLRNLEEWLLAHHFFGLLQLQRLLGRELLLLRSPFGLLTEVFRLHSIREDVSNCEQTPEERRSKAAGNNGWWIGRQESEEPRRTIQEQVAVDVAYVAGCGYKQRIMITYLHRFLLSLCVIWITIGQLRLELSVLGLNRGELRRDGRVLLLQWHLGILHLQRCWCADFQVGEVY